MGNTTTSSAIAISFRYTTEEGISSTSKISLSCDIFDHLCILFDGEKAARTWLSAKAKEFKEGFREKTSSYVREASLMMIINDELLDGYDIKPEYTLYQSEVAGGGETADTKCPVCIPSSMLYALKKMGLRYQEEIDLLQQELRNTKFTGNDSDYIRSALLKKMIY